MKIIIEYSFENTAWPYVALTKINGRVFLKSSDKSYADAERSLLHSIHSYQPPPGPKEVEL